MQRAEKKKNENQELNSVHSYFGVILDAGWISSTTASSMVTSLSPSQSPLLVLTHDSNSNEQKSSFLLLLVARTSVAYPATSLKPFNRILMLTQILFVLDSHLLESHCGCL